MQCRHAEAQAAALLGSSPISVELHAFASDDVGELATLAVFGSARLSAPPPHPRQSRVPDFSQRQMAAAAMRAARRRETDIMKL